MKIWKDMQPVVESLNEWWRDILPLSHRVRVGWPFSCRLEVEALRESRHWPTRPTRLIRFGRPLVRLLLSLIVDVRLSGVENLPTTGACILASNHLSMLDPILLCALLPRYPYFMSKQELFRHPLLAWFLRHAGAFPVDRSGGDVWAMAYARRILQEGQVLGIFPEGTRSRQGGILGKGKTGTVRLALETNAPIVPVAIFGSDLLFVEHRRIWRLPSVHIQIGAPLRIGDMIIQIPPDYEEIQALTMLLMRRIAEMLPPEKRGEHDG